MKNYSYLVVLWLSFPLFIYFCPCQVNAHVGKLQNIILSVSFALKCRSNQHVFISAVCCVSAARLGGDDAPGTDQSLAQQKSNEEEDFSHYGVIYLRCETWQWVVCSASGSLEGPRFVLGSWSEWRTRSGEDLRELPVLSTLSAAGICSSRTFYPQVRLAGPLSLVFKVSPGWSEASEVQWVSDEAQEVHSCTDTVPYSTRVAPSLVPPSGL